MGLKTSLSKPSSLTGDWMTHRFAALIKLLIPEENVIYNHLLLFNIGYSVSFTLSGKKLFSPEVKKTSFVKLNNILLKGILRLILIIINIYVVQISILMHFQILSSPMKFLGTKYSNLKK